MADTDIEYSVNAVKPLMLKRGDVVLVLRVVTSERREVG